MQACCALRLTCRGASPAYQPTPASQRPCSSPISVPRRLDAVKLRPRRSRKAADSIDSDAVGTVQQESAASCSDSPASRSEQDKHDDLDAGYNILFPPDQDATSKPNLHHAWHHYHPNLVFAYTASLQRLARVLLSGEFKLTNRLTLAWRRVTCLAIELVQENQGVLVALLGLAWYTTGISLIGRATFQLVVFSPEALTPPWISVIIAVQHALLHLSDFVLEKCALVFASFTAASVLEKILLVIFSVTPLVMLFAPLYRAATGSTWAQAMFKIHAIVNRLPGASMVAEPNLQAHAVVNLAFFCGTFTFAVFLGIVSDEVKRSFQHMRHASYPTHLSGHTVVLNWTSDTIPLLKQLDLGRRYSDSPIFKRPIVVLAPRDKAEMEKEVASRLRNTQLEIHTRFGNPSFPKHLDMVAAHCAHTCIVLQPEGLASAQLTEAANTATAMALGITGCRNVVFQVAKTSYTVDYLQVLQPSSSVFATPATVATAATAAAAAAPPAVVTAAAWAAQHSSQQPQQPQQLQQSQHPRYPPAPRAPTWQQTAGGVHGGSRPAPRLLTMPDHNFQDRIMCQTSVQPGVLGLWRKLLQEGPNCFKLRLVPLPAACVEMPYQHVRRCLPDCVVIGCMRDGQVQLNPDDSRLMLTGDQLVVVSYVHQPRIKLWAQQLFRAAAEAVTQRTSHPCKYQEQPKNIIVAGWRESDLQDITQGFADAAPSNSRVTFVLQHVPKASALPRRTGSCHFRYLRAEHPTSVKALLDAGIKTADTVVLTGLVQGDASTLEADTLVLSSLLQVQSAVRASGRSDAPHVIASVNHNSTRQVIQEFFQKPSSDAAGAEQQQRVMWYDWQGQPQAPTPNKGDRKHSTQPSCSHGSDGQEQLHQGQQPGSVLQGPGSGGLSSPSTALDPAVVPAASEQLLGSPGEGGGVSQPGAVMLPAKAGSSSLGGIAAKGRAPLANCLGFFRESVAAFNDMVQQADAADAEDSADPPPVVHMHTVDLLADDSMHQLRHYDAQACGGDGGAASSSSSGGGGDGSYGGIAAVHVGHHRHHHHNSSGRYQRQLPRAAHTSRHPDVPNPEVFMPDDVRTALLAQVATQPEITEVVRQLLTQQEGAEFVLRSPSALNIEPGETLSFAEVAEAARQLQHTAVGYLLASGQLAMVLEPLTQHTFQEGDQIVLITTGPRG